MKKYDYSKLLGRMKERGITQEQLAKKIGIDKEKMPANVVETLGNSASSTIPNVITLNLKNRPESETIPLCLAAFGEGLIWSATILNLGPLGFCKMIEMDI